MLVGTSLLWGLPFQVEANDDNDVAQELTNPIADLVTMPFQMNFDNDIGPEDAGSKVQSNIQPVIPFSLNEDWNLISRTTALVIYQEDIIPDSGFQFGLGDIT